MSELESHGDMACDHCDLTVCRINKCNCFASIKVRMT